jgi:hypothetical protein
MSNPFLYLNCMVSSCTTSSIKSSVVESTQQQTLPQGDVAIFLAVVATAGALLLDVDVVMAGTTTSMVENGSSASCVAGRDIRS